MNYEIFEIIFIKEFKLVLFVYYFVSATYDFLHISDINCYNFINEGDI